MTDKHWQYTAATVLLSFLIVVGWCAIGILEKITDYSILWDPPQASEIVKCCVYGLISVAAALKLDIPLLGLFLKGDAATIVAKLSGQNKENTP